MAKTKSSSNINVAYDFKGTFSNITSTLEEFFTQKAPALPSNAKETIVKLAPAITIIVLILALPPILLVLGLGALVVPFAFLGGITTGFGYSLGLIFLVIALILEALSIPGLIARSRSGWNFAYYAAWVSTIHSLIAGDIISALLSFAISMWVLFQVRSYYTK